MDEKQTYQGTYDRKHMLIPKTTKVAIKIWLFNLIDIGIVVLLTMLGLRLGNIYSTLPVFKIISAVLGFMIGIFLIMRTNAAPGMRNWRVLLFVLLQDKASYYPISLSNEDEQKPKKRKEEKKLLFINRTKEQKKAEEDIRNTLALGGPINCTEDGIMIFPDGKVSRFLKVASTALFDLSDSELEKWQDSLTHLSRTYLEDCSYFAMPSKLNTSVNQRYWRYMRQHCDTSTIQGRRRANDISEQIAKAEMVERRPDQYSSKDYYAEIYAESIEEIRKATNMFILESQELHPQRLNRAQTEAVLCDLNNPSDG